LFLSDFTTSALSESSSVPAVTSVYSCYLSNIITD
jgi:hypothetical protein